MTGVLDGVDVLDLTSGIAGPMTGMLLADHGARGHEDRAARRRPDPRVLAARRCGTAASAARCSTCDDAADRDRLLALAAQADVLLESYAPGTTAGLGIDYETLQRVNPRLVYCSITAYGDDGEHADRPRRRARRGAHRPPVGEPRRPRRHAGAPRRHRARVSRPRRARRLLGRRATSGPAVRRRAVGEHGVVLPRHAWRSAPRCACASRPGRGPARVDVAVPGCARHDALGVAAGRARRRPRTSRAGSATRGPRRACSGAPTAAGSTSGCPSPTSSSARPRATASQRTEKTTTPRNATTRIGMDVNEMLLLHHYQPLMAAAVAKFPSEPWVALGAEVGVPLQPLRSPEEALHDPRSCADGCVIEVDDPELGPVRQVGRVYELHACPTDAPTAPPVVGARHRRGARRGRRPRGLDAATATATRRGGARRRRSPASACSTSGSRSPDRGGR